MPADRRRATGPGTLVAILQTTRPRQWVKNLVVFAALIFSLRLTDSTALGRACLAFVLFCATSGAVYIVNDLFDAERDRRHPGKSRRPIASGALGSVAAIVAATLLLTGSLMAGSRCRRRSAPWCSSTRRSTSPTRSGSRKW